MAILQFTEFSRFLSGCRGLSFEFIFASPSHRIRYFCRSSTFDALTSLLGFSLNKIQEPLERRSRYVLMRTRGVKFEARTSLV